VWLLKEAQGFCFYGKSTELGFWGILGQILSFGPALRPTRWVSPLKKRHKRKRVLHKEGSYLLIF